MGIFIFGFIFFVYAFTAPLSVTLEDSGIFLVTISELGISHPPGYPVYTLLGHLFSLLPFSTVAYKVHLLSALCGAGSCAILYQILRSFKIKEVSATGASLLLGFSFTFWSQSIIAEVYALNTFFVLLILWLLIRQYDYESDKEIFLIALVTGLAFANHWPLLGLCGPGLIFVAWGVKDKLLTHKKLILLGLAMGLSAYLYLIIRSLTDPSIAFLGPIDSLEGFIKYVGRDHYSNVDRQKTAGWGPNLYFFFHFLKMLCFEASLAFPVLFLMGLKKAWDDLTKPLFFGLILIFLSSSAILLTVFFLEFNDFNVNIYSVFQMVPMAIGAIYVGFGLQVIYDYLMLKTHFIKQAMVALVVLLTGIVLYLNFDRNDLKKEPFAADFAKLILKNIPQNSTLLVRGDTDVGPIAYMNIVDKYRSDIKVLNQSGHFFRERIFDPTEKDIKVRMRKTVDFLKKENRVFSTRSLDFLRGVKDHPFNLQFNGLFYEVSLDELKTKNTPEFIEQVKGFATKYSEKEYGGQWAYHRSNIFAQICNFLILEEIDHRIFTFSPTCGIIKGKHLARFKKYESANKYFTLAVNNTSGMSLYAISDLNFHYVKNKAELINTTPGSMSTKMKAFQELANEVQPIVKQYPYCDNPTIGALLGLKLSIDIDIQLPYIVQKVKKCKNFKDYLKRLKVI